MLASRQGRARLRPAADWEIQVLPPSEAAFDSGARAYRCVATEIGHLPGVTQFGGLSWLMAPAGRGRPGLGTDHRHSRRVVPTAFGM
jgi:hypothetical protein